MRVETRAGQAHLHDVRIDILPGASREMLVKRPEWDAFGIQVPDDFLATRIENTIGGRRCARVQVVDIYEDYNALSSDALPDNGHNEPECFAADKNTAISMIVDRAQSTGAPFEFIERWWFP